MAIAVDAVTHQDGASSPVAHSVSGSDRLLLVCVQRGTPSALAYNGTSLNQHISNGNASIWVLAAPSTGSNNLTFTGSADITIISLTGVNQSIPIYASASASASGDSPIFISANVSSESGMLVVDSMTAAYSDDEGGSQDLDRTAGTGQTTHQSALSNNNEERGSSRKNGAAGSTTVSWDLSGNGDSVDMRQVAVSVSPAGEGGGGEGGGGEDPPEPETPVTRVMIIF